MQKVCQVHPQVEAVWQCEKCAQCHCQACIDNADGVFDPITTRCPSCRGRCLRLAAGEPATVASGTLHRSNMPAVAYGGAGLHLAEQARVEMKGKSWTEILLNSFAYPVRNDNWWALVVAMVFFIGVDFIKGFSFLLAAFFTVFFAGYICSYWISITRHTIQGDMDLPLWPDFNEDGIARPLFMFFVPTIFAVGPGIAVAYWYRAPVMGNVLLYAGLALLPMMMLAAIVLNNPLAANPVLAVPATFRVPGPYLSVVGMFVLSTVLLQIATWVGLKLGFVGNLLIRYANLYFSVLTMHVLGLFYFRYSNEISWYED